MPPFSFSGGGQPRDARGKHQVISAPLPGSGRLDNNDDIYANYFSGPSTAHGHQPWLPPQPDDRALAAVQRAAFEERRRDDVERQREAWQRQAQPNEWNGPLTPMTPGSARPPKSPGTRGKLKAVKREERELRRREVEEEDYREHLQRRDVEDAEYREHLRSRSHDDTHRSAPQPRPRPSVEAERVVIESQPADQSGSHSYSATFTAHAGT
jgi:hypothetical protein